MEQWKAKSYFQFVTSHLGDTANMWKKMLWSELLKVTKDFSLGGRFNFQKENDSKHTPKALNE